MNRGTIFVFIFIILLALIGYTWYNYSRQPADTPAPQAESDKTVVEVRRLKNLELDTSLFQDRFFRDLTEPKEKVEPEATPGRENPFAPFR